MTRNLGLLIGLCLLLFFGLMVAGHGWAQGYPSKPIRLIVPFAPGGGTDIVARVIAPKLGERLAQQQVVIDNRPGATGIIGANIVAKAVPDGYTLLMGSVSSNAMAASVFSTVPYDSEKDFSPIILCASVPQLVVVNPSLEVRSIKELIAHAKAHPGKLSFPSAGIGSSPHLAGEVFKMITGTDMVHVPYKGSGQSLQDLLGGQLQLAFDTVPVALPFVKAGKLRPLAVLAPRRSPLLPDVPTTAETGVPGAEATTWYGIFAPAGTPPSIVNRVHAETQAVMELADVKARLIANGADGTVTRSPDEFVRMVKSEIVKYAKVVKVAGVRAE